MDADGSNQVDVGNWDAATLGKSQEPAWSPDGSRILYTSVIEGEFELFTMSPDGGNRVNITNTPGWTEYLAAWSPDGEHVAFQSNRGNADGIYVMRADGTGAIRITPPGDYFYEPIWIR